MFGKKKQPSPPFVLQVLTTEYLIEGTVEGDTLLYFPELDILDSPPLRLTSVQVQTTRPADIPTRTCTQFMVMGDSAVALIPRMEVSQLAQYEAWKVADIPLLGMFYFGPYVMQGKLMLLRDGFFEGEMSMFDVHIASRIPGTRWGELHAPFALVNGRWLHGYEPS
jgi:hypothetical protein